METMDALMRRSPVIPVLIVEDPAQAQPLARALVARGYPVLEVTLRTAAALEVIAEMAKVEGAIVGAGTVLNARALDASLAAGARFIVSPGLTEPLAAAARASSVPFLPGVATAADIMRGFDLGLDRFKFFPAENYGGVATLKAFAGPFPQVRFCPTGGITEASAPSYLALPNVACVGGTFVTPKTAVDTGDWTSITELARRASALAASS